MSGESPAADQTPGDTLSPDAGAEAARRVAINALSPFALQIVSRVLMLGYAIAQYRVLGAEAGGVLGDYIVAGLVLMYAGTIGEWGLGTLLTREVARERGSAEAVSRDFRQTLALRLAISFALFLPAGLFIAIYTAFFGLSASGAWAVALLTVSLLPSAFAGSVTAVLYAYERMSLPALTGAATALLNVVLGIGALLLGWGVIGLALAALFSTVVTALFFWAILGRDFPYLRAGFDFSSLRLGRSAATALLKAGWPLMLNALLVGLFFRVDQFIVYPVVGELGVQRYQAAYSYLNFVLLITPAVTLALFPRMARHAVSDRPRLRTEYVFALKVLMLIAVPIVALTVWFAPLLVTVVTGGKAGFLPYSAIALQILIFFLPLSFVNGVTQYVLIALDRQRLITRAFGATVLFNVVANLVLVPWLGIYGAGLTTVLSELVLLVPFIRWVARDIGRLPAVEIAAKPVMAGALVAAAGWLARSAETNWQAGVGEFAAYLAVGAALLFLYLVVVAFLRPFSAAEWGLLTRAVKRKSARSGS